MDSTRHRKAQLAIDAIIRGLERDQVAFAYDELEAALVPDGAHALQVAAQATRVGEPPLEAA